MTHVLTRWINTEFDFHVDQHAILSSPIFFQYLKNRWRHLFQTLHLGTPNFQSIQFKLGSNYLLVTPLGVIISIILKPINNYGYSIIYKLMPTFPPAVDLIEINMRSLVIIRYCIIICAKRFLKNMKITLTISDDGLRVTYSTYQRWIHKYLTFLFFFFFF